MPTAAIRMIIEMIGNTLFFISSPSTEKEYDYAALSRDFFLRLLMKKTVPPAANKMNAME